MSPIESGFYLFFFKLSHFTREGGNHDSQIIRCHAYVKNSSEKKIWKIWPFLLISYNRSIKIYANPTEKDIKKTKKKHMDSTHPKSGAEGCPSFP